MLKVTSDRGDTMYKTNTKQNQQRRHLRGITAFLTVLSVVTSLVLPFQKASAISYDTRPTLVGNEIHMGPTGGRIKMEGVNVWGIETITLSGFGNDQYADRVNIINTIKSWGANHIRFRLQASDYDAQTYMTKAEYLNRIQQWKTLAESAGLYINFAWWDGHDGPYSDTNWATNYSQAFTMMTDVVNAIGPNDPMVFYEPFNEPTGAPNDVQWLNAMKDTVRHFRNDLHYTGILLIDPRVWSHCYEDTNFTALEQYDSTLTGMNGTHQIIFTKHDYANEYTNPDGGFDSSEWPTNSGGCGTWNFTKHATWESEFGNYNGSPTSVHLPWSQGAATWMGNKVKDATITGATAFLFGPWLDQNAMTTSDNSTPTVWGGYVKNLFLGAGYGMNGIGTLGNFVFYDRNRNGLYEPSDGDKGLANVTVAVYSVADNSCSIGSGASPLVTATTDANGKYLFTLLPTDDNNASNGAGARYAVAVTDQNGVLADYTATTGTANTNDNAQAQPAFCVNLTNTASDIQYADFGFGPKSGAASGGRLVDTGLSIPLTIGAAATIIAVSSALTIWQRRNRQLAAKYVSRLMH